jgi:hypothetical protein
MGLSGKEVQEMHKQYILQSWGKAGQDVLPIEKAEGIYFGITMEINMQIWHLYWCVQTLDMNYQRS